MRQVDNTDDTAQSLKQDDEPIRRNLFDTSVISEKIRPDLGEPLLLGSWCREEIGGTFSDQAEILDYHWDDRSQLDSDSQIIFSAVDTVLEELAPKLNKLLQREITSRGWEIMLGYWLTQFGTVTLDRLRQLERAKQTQYKLFFQHDDANWTESVPRDSQEAQGFFENDLWNNHFLHHLIKLTGIATSIPTKGLIAHEPSFAQGKARKLPSLYGSMALRVVLDGLQVLKRKSSKTFVIGQCSLKPSQILRLAWLLPGRVHKSPNLQPPEGLLYSAELRNWTLATRPGMSKFEVLFRELIPKWMPMIYLEGFNDAANVVARKFPTVPRTIFTTTSHFHDSYFKIWAGHAVSNGAKLVVGQHGHGAPGKFNGAQRFDLSVSDLYLSSGSVRGPFLHSAGAGQFWSRIPRRTKVENGNALLVTCVMPKRAFDIRSMPVAGQTSDDIDYTQDFFRNLPTRIQQRTRVRIYPSADYGWDQTGRWRRAFPAVQIDRGTKALPHSLRQARLAVISYQASVYAETLAADIPSVIFWDETRWEISETARNDFDLLEEVGIFHRSPESAAEQVTKIWSDIHGWWNEERTQAARKEFCLKYAYRFPHPMTELALAISSVDSGPGGNANG